MQTIQQVIDGLNCFTTNQHKCKDCPWNPHPGMQWPYGCMKGQIDIAEAAKRLLKFRRSGFGTWLKVDDEPPEAWDCSECGAMCAKKHNFCPCCGARMDIGEEGSEDNAGY